MTVRGQMTRAVADSLREAGIAPRDVGAAQLARRYAQLLDAARDTEQEPAVYGDLGPKLLAALTSLGLTVAGRSKPAGGGKPDVGTGSARVDELRARRARRQREA